MTPAPATPSGLAVPPGSVVVPLPPEFFAPAQDGLAHPWGPMAASANTPPFQAPPFPDMAPPAPPFIGAPPLALPPIKEGLYAQGEWGDEAADEFLDEMPDNERDAVTMGLQLMKGANADALMSSPAFQQVANAVITGQMTLDEALPLMLSLATQNGASS
jgi:hypothetical protein